VAVLSQTQAAMLQTLWPVVRVGGRLLYSTCSIFEAEGGAVAHDFLQATPQANQLDSHGLWLPSMPHNLTDGFYDALFEKTAV
jgi:16S rRNA (cytosine967-C5)-methyltransferase